MSRQQLHKDQHGAMDGKESASRQKRRKSQSFNQVLQLQQTRGNQAVQRLLAEGRFSSNGHPVQAKLTVGAPGSVHEQEADSVAQQVMSMPDQAVQRDEQLEDEDMVQTQLVQREEQLDDEELVQAKFIQREEQLDDDEMVQTQLVQREEKLEDEEMVQAKFVQREENLEDEELVQAKFVQREENLEDEEMLQAKSDTQVPEVTSDVETMIEQKRGGGQPLPDSTREFFEPRFGQDFSGVKVHTDAQADSLNRDLQARAFATGSDIFFRSGEYQPDSSGGRELLAHELTHVVQQGASSQIGRKPTAIAPAKAPEVETFTILIAGKKKTGITRYQAYSLLDQEYIKLDKIVIHGREEHANKVESDKNQYLPLSIWDEPNKALDKVVPPLYYRDIKDVDINQVSELLQDAEMPVHITALRAKNPIVNKETIKNLEITVGVLEVIKKICFTLFGEEYPFLGPVIEAFSSELGESLAGLQDDQTSKDFANRLPDIFSGLLGSLDKSIGHEAGLAKGIFDEFMLAGTNILTDVKEAEDARKGKKLSSSAMTSIILKEIGLAAVGIITRLSKSSIYKVLHIKY